MNSRNRLRLLAPLALALLALGPGEAMAHGPGTSQLLLTIDGARVDGAYELDLRDARLALGLDTTLAGAAGWRDLQGHAADLRSYVGGRIHLTADRLPCPLEPTAVPPEWQAALGTVRVPLAATAKQPPTRLGISTEVFFDRDSTHRFYFTVQDARATSIGVLRTNLRSVTFGVQQFHFFPILLEFIGDGIGYVRGRLDFLLFLLALLLPVGLVRAGGDWVPRPGVRAAYGEGAKLAAAFTVAHSITLALDYFGVVRLPALAVGVGIAISVFLAAWNNLRPFLRGRAWVIAFWLGLVHGFALAGALINLPIPRKGKILGLVAFNAGVEIALFAIALAAIALISAASRRREYPRFVMGVGSLLISWMAVIWALERGFSLTLFARH